MLKGAKALGDQGTVKSDDSFDPDWLPAFKQDIHGLILVAGDSHHTVHEHLDKIKDIFHVGHHDASVHEVLRLVGDVRPGDESGHEQYVSNSTILICGCPYVFISLASSTVCLSPQSLAWTPNQILARKLSGKESSS